MPNNFQRFRVASPQAPSQRAAILVAGSLMAVRLPRVLPFTGRGSRLTGRGSRLIYQHSPITPLSLTPSILCLLFAPIATFHDHPCFTIRRPRKHPGGAGSKAVIDRKALRAQKGPKYEAPREISNDLCSAWNRIGSRA